MLSKALGLKLLDQECRCLAWSCGCRVEHAQSLVISVDPTVTHDGAGEACELWCADRDVNPCLQMAKTSHHGLRPSNIQHTTYIGGADALDKRA